MIYEDLGKICQHYGIRKQIKKLSEEVFELQEAVIDNEWDVAEIPTTLPMNLQM